MFVLDVHQTMQLCIQDTCTHMRTFEVILMSPTYIYAVQTGHASNMCKALLYSFCTHVQACTCYRGHAHAHDVCMLSHTTCTQHDPSKHRSSICIAVRIYQAKMCQNPLKEKNMRFGGFHSSRSKMNLKCNQDSKNMRLGDFHSCIKQKQNELHAIAQS